MKNCRESGLLARRVRQTSWEAAAFTMPSCVESEFLHTGKPPLSAEESLESIEFIAAAQLSAKRDGAEVFLQEFRQ